MAKKGVCKLSGGTAYADSILNHISICTPGPVVLQTLHFIILELTWTIWKEAAWIVLKLFHEADLSVLFEAEEVSLAKYKYWESRVIKRNDADIQGLLTYVQDPVGLWKKMSSV